MRIIPQESHYLKVWMWIPSHSIPERHLVTVTLWTAKERIHISLYQLQELSSLSSPLVTLAQAHVGGMPAAPLRPSTQSHKNVSSKALTTKAGNLIMSYFLYSPGLDNSSWTWAVCPHDGYVTGYQGFIFHSCVILQPNLKTLHDPNRRAHNDILSVPSGFAAGSLQEEAQQFNRFMSTWLHISTYHCLAV